MQAEKDRIQAIKASLTAKGIQQSDYGQLRRDLNELKQLQESIAAERGEQFYDDAFAATAGLGLSREQIVAVARRMRLFAEKIAAAQAVQNATPSSDIGDVVDNTTPTNPTT
jgi:transcription elongation GreA/GreB family factor